MSDSCAAAFGGPGSGEKEVRFLAGHVPWRHVRRDNRALDPPGGAPRWWEDAMTPEQRHALLQAEHDAAAEWREP